MKYDVFLSHSEQDAELIEKIHSTLTVLEISCYVEEYNPNYGVELIQSICEAIDESQRVIVILSPESIISQWVNQEIGYSYCDDKDIIPIWVGDIEVKGMIMNLKGIKSKNDSHEEIIKSMINYFVIEDEHDMFKVTCERCGNEEHWMLPEPTDYLNWDREKKPMVDNCGECNYNEKINPNTLTTISSK